MGAYAVIENDNIEVVNTILANPDFAIDGFYLIEYDSGKVFCQKGMFYNQKDGLFYDDKNFKSINGNDA